MTGLAERLLEAIGEQERLAANIGNTCAGWGDWATAACHAHRRIVQRYQLAVQLAEGDARARRPLQPYSETRVAVLADVLGVLADVYGVGR